MNDLKIQGGAWRPTAAAFALAFAVATLIGVGPAGDASVVGAAMAQQSGTVPGNTLGSEADSDLWRTIRQGGQGTVSIPDRQAGQLIQSEGDNWRAIRNGPLSNYGVWLLIGMIAVLALFFVLRGRIKIEAGPSGRTMERFSGIERFAHWLTAISFILLALTGLNLLYGRYFLPDMIGPEAFASLTAVGKWLHNWIAFGFMAGLALIFLLWVRHNIPNKHDLIWLSRAGGLFSKHSHPPSWKFNAGQKLIFWVTIIGGVSLSLSGWALLAPFETTMWQSTLAIFSPGVTVTPMEEQQYNVIWHSAISMVMIAMILAHIYIGSVGMEGAFSAMGSGQVDRNWAKEHHNLWVAEVEAEAKAKPDPASDD